jgi:methyl-accepting chemotaxis protein
MKLMAALAQTDPAAVEALQRIATSQIVMAVVMGLFGVLGIIVAVVALIEVRAARRFMMRTVNDLKPQMAPLIDRAKNVTDDVAGMTDNVRRKVDDVIHTVEEMRRSVERVRVSTEERAERFGAVLDIVQAETEELLLDAAATAHGVQETARVLRETGSRRDRHSTGPRDGLAPVQEEEPHEGP